MVYRFCVRRFCVCDCSQRISKNKILEDISCQMIENSERRSKNFVKEYTCKKHSNKIFSSHGLTFSLTYSCIGVNIGRVTARKE